MTLDLTLNANGKSITSSPGSSSTTVSVSCLIESDTRGARISSSFDPTYLRILNSSGQPQRIPSPFKDGVTHVHTRSPEYIASQQVQVQYLGHHIGNWGVNSNFHWHSARTQQFAAGTFISYPVADFFVNYDEETAKPGDVEHIHLRLTDSIQGTGGQPVSATANCYVYFHAAYENWARTQTIAHPLPINPYPQPAGADWTIVDILYNPTSVALSDELSLKTDIKRTMQGTIGVEIGLDIAVLKAFSINESITVGEEVTVSKGSTWTFTAPARTRIEGYFGQIWEERTGTCSVWKQNGYDSDVSWQGTKVTDQYGKAQRVVMIYHEPG